MYSRALFKDNHEPATVVAPYDRLLEDHVDGLTGRPLKQRFNPSYRTVTPRGRHLRARAVAVDVAGKDANYLRTQLNKRIEARRIVNVKVSVVNNVCYLEK